MLYGTFVVTLAAYYYYYCIGKLVQVLEQRTASFLSVVWTILSEAQVVISACHCHYVLGSRGVEVRSEVLRNLQLVTD